MERSCDRRKCPFSLLPPACSRYYIRCERMEVENGGDMCPSFVWSYLGRCRMVVNDEGKGQGRESGGTKAASLQSSRGRFINIHVPPHLAFLSMSSPLSMTERREQRAGGKGELFSPFKSIPWEGISLIHRNHFHLSLLLCQALVSLVSPCTSSTSSRSSRLSTSTKKQKDRK